MAERLSVFLPLCSSCTVRNCYRPSKWNICVNEQQYIYLQISCQHVNNQIDVMSFRETSSCCFSFCFPFLCYIYICSDVTPFHSARQYASTGFELTSFRLCKASYVWSKGTYIICTRCTALSCCSDELLVTVRSTAQRQSTFTDELLLKKTFISFLCFSVTCVSSAHKSND